MSLPGSVFSQRHILLFWAPLAASWALMSAEVPVLQAAIARLPDMQTQLAAFGIVMSLEIAIESPVIMLLATSTAMCTSGANYRTVRSLHELDEPVRDGRGRCGGFHAALLLDRPVRHAHPAAHRPGGASGHADHDPLVGGYRGAPVSPGCADPVRSDALDRDRHGSAPAVLGRDRDRTWR